MLVAYEDAADAAVKLSRTIGYPKGDPAAFSAFVDAIITACNRNNVAPEKLTAACSGMSEYCPTDVDLNRVAKDLAGEAPWQPPKPSNCTKCYGSGWQIIYALHTREGNGEVAFTRKEIITAEHAEMLESKIDPKKQQIYSVAKRCTAGCPVPAVRL